MGHQSASKTNLQRCAGRQRRFSLPGTAQARTSRMDSSSVEVERKQPPREVLFADAVGTEATRKGDSQLEPRLRGHFRHSEAQRGLNMHIEQWLYSLPLRLRSFFRPSQV